MKVYRLHLQLIDLVRMDHLNNWEAAVCSLVSFDMGGWKVIFFCLLSGTMYTMCSFIHTAARIGFLLNFFQTSLKMTYFSNLILLSLQWK